MPIPSAVSLHVDRYLTNYSVAYIQDQRNFVAPLAASVIPVLKQSDKYVVLDRGYFWRDEVAPRPLGGRPVQAGYKVGSGNYNAEEYALEHTIDDRQRANTDQPINLDQNATRLLTTKHMIKADRVWATSFFKDGVFSYDVVGVSSNPGAGQFLQFDQSGSDPIGVIDATKDAMAQLTGFMPNTIVAGAKVKRVLRKHSQIQEAIKYTQRGLADNALLAQLFEVQNFIVPRSVYNSADEGAADSFKWIIDERSLLVAYIEPNPSLDSPTAIALFAWTGLIPGQTNNFGGVIERGRDDRAHSDYFQGRMAWDMKVVAPDLGAFLKNAVAA